MKKPRIMFDHDGRHPLIYMYEPPIQKEEWQAGVDELIGTPIEALMLMLGDIRSLLYDSNAGELWGRDVRCWPHVVWRRAKQNFTALIEQGHDPLRVLCNRAHEKGLLIYGQLLTQQGPRERMLKSWEKEDFEEEDWRLDLQPSDIGSKTGVDPDWPGYRCPDFMYDEVRDQTLAVIEEVVTNYPIDGFELQLTYTPYYFHPEEVEAGRLVMTEWMGRVREVVKAKGSDLELAAHVPADIDGCQTVGLEPLEWVQRGIVDVIIPEASGMADQSADFSPFVNAAKGTSCRVCAAIQNRVNSDRIGEGTVEMMRAGACNFWAQGVDGLYLVHWFGAWPYDARFYEMLREIGDPEVMATKDKFYRIPTAADGPARTVVAPHTPDPLPVELTEGETVKLGFVVSDDLPRWGELGRVHEVLLRVRVSQTTELDRVEFALNGILLPERLLRRLNQTYIMSAPRFRATGYWFIYRLEEGYWPVKGSNTLEVMLTHKDSEVIPSPSVRDVEMEVKYLMGKAFHRGFVDADLGAYENRVL